jgi:outer membrane biosynthesis protein TonB
LVFFKSALHARVRLVLASILFALLVLNGVSAAQQSAAQQSSPQPSVAQQSSAQQSAAPKRPAKAAKKPVPEPPPPPAPPPPPPTLEQMPALPPQVRYDRGRLTIVAENSTLADILRAVRTQTGAVVEVPPNASERVVTHLGPGPARDVLAALLNGTHFNYVMLGSPAHPDSVERLILTSKSGGDSEPVQAAPAGQSNNPVQMDDVGPQGMDIAEQPGDDPAENTNGEIPQPQPNAQQVKTPEQLLRELQQQQQLQQEQQQKQQPPPAGAPPQAGPN